MIISKVITGQVIQKFDSETRRCISQEFIEDGPVLWEDEHHNRELNLNDPMDCELIYGQDQFGPEHKIELVQPAKRANDYQLDKSDKRANDYQLGVTVLVVPLDNGDEPTQEFMGKIVGIKDDTYIQVTDQDGNVFDCEPKQVYYVK